MKRLKRTVRKVEIVKGARGWRNFCLLSPMCVKQRAGGAERSGVTGGGPVKEVTSRRPMVGGRGNR